jgi:CubicO group peptidase (beta-lactamase class C family)
VTRHLPGFEMADPYVTRELTVRDLLTHRSGLARGDMMWYAGAHDRDEIVRRARFLRPSWSFRSRFGYQNIMYVTAGQVAARAGGASWDELVRRRLFEPLGMREATTTTRGLEQRADLAQPHALVDDTVRTIPWKNIDNAGPAGSINASALEMTRWVRFQLDSGRVNGRRILQQPTFLATHQPQTVVPLAPASRGANPFTHVSTYALGWFVDDYRGRELVHHGGNIDGMSAMVATLPEERIGVVVLSNMNGSPITTVLRNAALDAAIGAPAHDWTAAVGRVWREQLAQGKKVERARDSMRVAGTRPSLALATYAGSYRDSLYGEARVTHEGGRLRLAFGEMTGELEHWHFDTFQARLTKPTLGKPLFSFTIDADGKPASLTLVTGPDGNAEEQPVFRRAPTLVDTTARVMVAAGDLARLVGRYTTPAIPVPVAVELTGGKLTLTVPGQPTYTLVAESPTRFRLTGPPGMPEGFFAAWKLDGPSVVSMTLEQPAPRPSLTFAPERTTPAASPRR